MTAEGAAPITCSNLDCRIAEGGRCVEGLEITSCPHFGKVAQEIEDDVEEIESNEEEHLYLKPAGLLQASEASRFLRAGDARLVAILGPSDTGKTSLIAGLYDLFQMASVAGLDFAGSDTLHAFEQACHDARTASRRDIPFIARTPRGDVRFYHVDLATAEGDKTAILLGDRAGEEYREAADDVSLTSEFIEVARADCLTILVDGERLLNSGSRHNLRSSILMMMQAMYDGGMLPNGVNLAIVLTKLDLVRGADNQQRVERDFQTLCEALQTTLSDVLGQVGIFEIAAAPKTTVLPRGCGVAGLLKFWMLPISTSDFAEQPVPSFNRAFSQLRVLDEIEESR
ncbi:TRAFAC clade GTPase domain-containing protein [Rhizobium sp. PP-CC-3G-465]|uniref:TRAFAC clade GTPase domain-containing protein n=1 Tax=Rhizobium sp. PP-CC-3G-465 TaxID=2135648 RepID=UPI00104D9D94|nr:hypothetical protein C8J33_1283 [Rhizobium sp. PP-CC-3G-465]